MFPVLKGEYNPSIISNLSVDEFFKENHPNEWLPQEFAEKSKSNYLDIYFTGLSVISTLRVSPSSHAYNILRYLETDEGVAMLEDAERALELHRITVENQIEYS